MSLISWIKNLTDSADNVQICYGNNNIQCGRSLNMSMEKGRLCINGEKIDHDIKIVVNGVKGNLDATYGSVEVNGNVGGNIKTASGEVSCGTVGGDVETASGDVMVKGDVGRGVTTMSGDVECGKVSGNIQTMSGDVTTR